VARRAAHRIQADYSSRNFGTKRKKRWEEVTEEEAEKDWEIKATSLPVGDGIDASRLRQVAMNIIIQKLGKSSSREIRDLFDQMKETDDDSIKLTSSTGVPIDPALRRAMKILDYTDSLVAERGEDDDTDTDDENNDTRQTELTDDEDEETYPEAQDDDETEGDDDDNDDEPTRTMSTKVSTTTNTDDLVRRYIDRAISTIGAPSSYTGSQQELSYGSHPAITATALAHMLWSHVVRPNVDTVIDATAGNGQDSVALAKLLFLPEDDTNASPQQPHGDDDDNDGRTTARLICMDVQEIACIKTQAALSAHLSAAQLERHVVQVIHGSHAELPPVEHPVGLIVYNLGFLPGSDKSIETRTESTIESLAQASTLIRIGGMISVMTYPRSNAEEDGAVAALLAELARKTQRFRINEHRQLARPMAPVLYTATRIK
jgi:hypothetical protein